jgi:hypothetical protein
MGLVNNKIALEVRYTQADLDVARQNDTKAVLVLSPSYAALG